MKPLATLAAGAAIVGAAWGVAVTAHAGGPPNDGGGGGGAPTAAPGSCSDADLTVTNGPIESASTMRRVVVSFKNTSSSACHLVGYPDANLVTAAGGVLVHVQNRPALAAHALTLAPGDVATADVESYAIETGPGTRAHARARWSSRLLATPCRTSCQSRCRSAVRPSAPWIKACGFIRKLLLNSDFRPHRAQSCETPPALAC